jgi:hypothetical protein
VWCTAELAALYNVGFWYLQAVHIGVAQPQHFLDEFAVGENIRSRCAVLEVESVGLVSPPPLMVAATCVPGVHVSADQPGAQVQFTMNGSPTAITWTGTASTGPYQLGQVPTLVGGFGNASLPVPAGGGTVTVQVHPGWGTGSYSVRLSISYGGQLATARFQRTSSGAVLFNQPSATLPLVGGGADEQVSVVLSFTCDSGQTVGDAGCVGGGACSPASREYNTRSDRARCPHGRGGVRSRRRTPSHRHRPDCARHPLCGRAAASAPHAESPRTAPGGSADGGS